MLKRQLTLVVALAISASLFAQGAGPQNPPAKEPPKQEQKQEPPKKEEPKKDEQKKEEPKKDPKVDAYEKAIKDLTKIDGPFTLYQRKKEILLELPESQLGKLFCMQASFNTGVMGDTLQAGFPVGDFNVQVFRFEKQEDNVWLIRPRLAHRWDENDPLKVASERSFPEAILGSFRIEQTNPDKKLLLVNFTQLFYGDVLRLSEAVQTVLGGPYMLDRDKTSAESIKGYPENTVVRMKMHYASARGGGEPSLLELLGLGGGNQLEDARSAPISVTYNLWYRKDSTFMPRLADSRVGFFTQDYFSLSKFANDDRTERYIARYQLAKKDPTAKISEPVKPIVWFIDPSVPKQYRDACKEGILFWNRAFESLGYKEAIQVKMVDDNDKDWDHADGRNNVLRWTMSEGSAYAIAMPRWDPVTGEVLNASVNLDANMLYAAFREHERFSNPGAAQVQRALEVLVNNDERDAKVSPQDYILYGHAAMLLKQNRDRLAQLGWHSDDCRYAEGKADSAYVMWEAARAFGGAKVSKEEYAREFLREIVAHEIGHTLGLRHNFVASTLLSPGELADDDVVVKRGTSASVMEYTPVNVMAVVSKGRNYYSPRIGEYDMWAIRYGYTDSDAKTSLGEKPTLSKIAALSGQPEHRFMTDEEADGFDPYVVRFDNSRDPVAYSAYVLQALKKIRDYAIANMPRAGESYAKRTQLIYASIARTFREGMQAARFVGGMSGNRNFRGDTAQAPTLAPVSPEKQREAVRLIVRNCFGSESFKLPAEVMQNLSQDPEDAMFWTAPLRDQIAGQQMMLYTILMSAQTTRRIAENNFKSAGKPGAYSMDEHFATLLGAAFSEIGANKPVPALRRDLQRFAVNALMIQSGAPAGGVNEDVRMLASDSLRRLSARFGTQLKNKSGLDGLTVVHLRDTKDTIDRFLARVNTGR